MGFWGSAYNVLDANYGGLLPGGEKPGLGLFDPRTEGQYAGVDRNNFNVPGSPELQNQFQRLMGGQDSVAQLQLRQAQAANMAQQQSMAAGAAPGNVAAAQLAAMQNIGRLNQGATGQATMAGIAERQQAQNGLMNLAQMQQQGGIAYEGNRAARAGAQMNTPTPGEQILGAGMGVAKIAAMAKGGVVTQPTRALIGEAGPEAVIPLAQLPNVMEQLQMAPAARPKMKSAPTPPPAQEAAGRRGILPGELAKFGPSEAQPFKLTPPPPPPLPLGYDLGKRR
jgi:hypothetical protein